MSAQAAWTDKDKGEPGEAVLIRIAITAEAFEATAATRALGSIGFGT